VLDWIREYYNDPEATLDGPVLSFHAEGKEWEVVISSVVEVLDPNEYDRVDGVARMSEEVQTAMMVTPKEEYGEVFETLSRVRRVGGERVRFDQVVFKDR